MTITDIMPILQLQKCQRQCGWTNFSSIHIHQSLLSPIVVALRVARGVVRGAVAQGLVMINRLVKYKLAEDGLGWLMTKAAVWTKAQSLVFFIHKII